MEEKFKLKPLRGDGGYTVVSARLTDEIVAKLDETAGKTGMSRNKVIQLACEYALDRLEII
ncbi:MAG: ribbon-helix-helix domain-containing protein [Oscillospiraceae bacterium]|nr:ribbon-helix-helix domain-containing protein [Oscillospiraceae bacterium]